MLFYTSTFAIFFAVVWGLVWASAAHTRLRLGILALASWCFYAWWDWRFLGLLLGSSLIDYLAGRGIARAGARAREGEGAGRRWLWLSLSFNLGVLALFKYFDFFAGSAAHLLGALGFEADFVTLEIVLPVGISFYTFQTLGYTIDVYRGRSEACEDPVAFATYVAFFPQLVAGPIERASKLIPALRARPQFAWASQLDGAARFALGLFEKLVIADSLGRLADRIFEARPDELGLAEVGLGTVAFAFQIWGDFAGYTDMAVGAAKMLGVELSENFMAPYLARSPREFWQRWHISLSTWLRDYLYVPLGGNRRGPLRTQINLALTMLLGGLWHGAAWTFVVWGAWHGLWLALHRGWLRLRGRMGLEVEAWRGPLGWGGSALAGLFTFAIVCVGWLLFRAPDFDSVARMSDGALTRWSGRPDHLVASTIYLLHYLWPAMVLQIFVRLRPELRRGATARMALCFLALWGVVMVLFHAEYEHGRQFIYFQF